MNEPRISDRHDWGLSSPFRAAVRLVSIVLFTIAIMAPQAVAAAFGYRAAKRVAIFYHRVCCRIIGLTVRSHGKICEAGPTLYVANHISYIDIVVLGSLLEASYIAKAEVSSWPVLGTLGKFDRTVYVHRRGAHAASQRDEIAGRLQQGDRLILFPEGTSADGRHVLPFKSALFAVAENHPPDQRLMLQPVTIAYTGLDGLPMPRFLMPHLAWYGNMTLMPHFFTLLGLGAITVDVTFHAPVGHDEFSSRKALAGHCQTIIADGLARSVQGREILTNPS
jgi:1-acyl-sn-glycerol-3-phosphate acyltransferase